MKPEPEFKEEIVGELLGDHLRYSIEDRDIFFTTWRDELAGPTQARFVTTDSTLYFRGNQLILRRYMPIGYMKHRRFKPTALLDAKTSRPMWDSEGPPKPETRLQVEGEEQRGRMD